MEECPPMLLAVGTSPSVEKNLGRTSQCLCHKEMEAWRGAVSCPRADGKIAELGSKFLESALT